MHPQLFKLFGEISAPSYFVLLVAGFMFATAVGTLWAKRIGQDPDVVIDLGLAMLLAGAAGARIAHVLVDGYFWDYVHLCTNPRDGGLAHHASGVLVAVVRGGVGRSAWLVPPHGGGLFRVGEVLGGRDDVLRRVHRGVGRGVVSAEARPIPPSGRRRTWRGSRSRWGWGFGRMGCLLAGCCFGVGTHGSLGLSFPGNSPASESQFKLHLLPAMRMPSLPVHPTQIYESAVSLAIAAVLLMYVHGRKRYDGNVFVWFVVLYATARFVLEFWRADDRGWFALAVDLAARGGWHWVIGAGALHWHLRKSRARLATPAAVV